MTTPSRKNLSRFITTEAISLQDEGSYQRVWDAVRGAFNTPRPDSVGYWRYPLFLHIGNRRKEPDILIVDRQWGIIHIEVCPVNIEQISWIDQNNLNFYSEDLTADYHFNNLYKYTQVLRKYCDQEVNKNQEYNINHKIRCKTLIAFPYISSQQWQDKRWQGLEEEKPFIFNDQLGENTLKSRLEKAHSHIEGESLNEQQYRSLLSVISGMSMLRKSLLNDNFQEKKTRYNIIAEAQNLMYEWDVKQEWISKSTAEGAQRIRGIAGSGKTVLFSQKAVITHLKHPHWRVAFIFFTRSLYDQIEELFKLWIERFTDGEITFENNSNSNLRVLHAWGARNRDGFYGELCKQFNKKASEILGKNSGIGIRKLLPNDSSNHNPNESLAYGCKDFLIKVFQQSNIRKKEKFKEIFKALIADHEYGFDALIIDEGQDLITGKDDLKVKIDEEEKEAIYWLAYQSLKPINENNDGQKRLIWAYDEAQTIHSKFFIVPSAKAVLGEKLSQILGGKTGGIYRGGIRKAYDMERCYRTPGNILTMAYALGTGLLREGDIIHPGRLRKKDLQGIGFKVLEGDFRSTTQPITITRPAKNSPNPVANLWQDSLIEFNIYNSRMEELSGLVDKIKFNLQEDQLKPSRNILVIALGYTTPPFYTGNKLETEIAQFLMANAVNIYIPSACKINQLQLGNDPDRFWHDDAITVSRIDRTKGNEADMVYLVGLDNIAQNEDDPILRNQLFVGLTRSRGWVSLSGIGDYHFYEEVNRVMAQKDTFTFTIKGITPSDDVNDDLTEEEENQL